MTLSTELSTRGRLRRAGFWLRHIVLLPAGLFLAIAAEELLGRPWDLLPVLALVAALISTWGRRLHDRGRSARGCWSRRFPCSARCSCSWNARCAAAHRAPSASVPLRTKPPTTRWCTRARVPHDQPPHRQRRDPAQSGTGDGDRRTQLHRGRPGSPAPHQRPGLHRRRSLQHGRPDRKREQPAFRHAHAQPDPRFLAGARDDPRSAGRALVRYPALRRSARFRREDDADLRELHRGRRAQRELSRPLCGPRSGGAVRSVAETGAARRHPGRQRAARCARSCSSARSAATARSASWSRSNWSSRATAG